MSESSSSKLKPQTANRLFQVRPDRIFEHPYDLPLDASDIKEGELEGWEAYAFNFDGDPTSVIGPFTPHIKRGNSSGELSIEVPGRKAHQIAQIYLYQTRGVWYQSGTTLRFIRKRDSK